MSARVLLVGPGDLGTRLAAGLARLPEVAELVLAGRGGEAGPALAALLAACGTARVRFAPLDAGDQAAVERLLARERPDLVVQCAAAFSPWLLPGRAHAADIAGTAGSAGIAGIAARAVLSAGFALQLPAQLPLVRTLMQAAAATGLAAPVVNCSYPDLTHPVLACEGLAPLVGIGNAGMIRARVTAALRCAGRTADPVRVLAHHAHVTPVVLSRPPDDPQARPRVYLGEAGERADDLAYAGPPLLSERGLNALPAASGLPLLRALLGGPPVRTSAPGPGGLPGGFPVRVSAGRVDLDLPPDLAREEAIAWQWQSARLDGVAGVERDGTVHFTAAARAAVAGLDPALAEPLSPSGAGERLRRLLTALQPA